MFKNYYWFWEAEIKEEYLDKWIKEHFSEDKIQKATINTNSEKNEYGLDEAIRKTEVVWIKPKTEIFDTIYNYITTANANAGWNFDLSGMEDVQLGRYTDGGFYDWHMDTFAPDEGNFQRGREGDGGDQILDYDRPEREDDLRIDSRGRG